MEEEAKKLKHEADHEENMEVKCTKYLQVPERPVCVRQFM